MSVKLEADQMDLLDELLDGVKDDPTPQGDSTQSTQSTEPPQTDVDTGQGSANANDDLDQQDDKEPNDIDGSKDEPPAQTEPQTGDTVDQTAILREQILKLTEQLQKDPTQQVVQQDVKSPSDQEPKKEVKLENFLTAEELDKVIDEPEILNTAFGRAISVIEQNIQGVIQAEVNRQILVSRAVSDFYTSNQDLAPYSKFVQFVMHEVEQQNPDKTYADIFQLTANETRKRLGLAAGQQPAQRQKSQPGAQRPAFAGTKKGTARPAGKQEFFDPNAADLFNLQ